MAEVIPQARVLVLLPTYNEADNLEPLVEALYGLAVPGLEVLVVDDQSPDGTAECDRRRGSRPVTPIQPFPPPSSPVCEYERLFVRNAAEDQSCRAAPPALIAEATRTLESDARLWAEFHEARERRLAAPQAPAFVWHLPGGVRVSLVPLESLVDLEAEAREILLSAEDLASRAERLRSSLRRAVTLPYTALGVEIRNHGDDVRPLRPMNALFSITVRDAQSRRNQAPSLRDWFERRRAHAHGTSPRAGYQERLVGGLAGLEDGRVTDGNGTYDLGWHDVRADSIARRIAVFAGPFEWNDATCASLMLGGTRYDRAPLTYLPSPVLLDRAMA